MQAGSSAVHRQHACRSWTKMGKVVLAFLNWNDKEDGKISEKCVPKWNSKLSWIACNHFEDCLFLLWLSLSLYLPVYWPIRTCLFSDWNFTFVSRFVCVSHSWANKDLFISSNFRDAFTLCQRMSNRNEIK